MSEGRLRGGIDSYDPNKDTGIIRYLAKTGQYPYEYNSHDNDSTAFGLIESYANVQRRQTSWLWPGYLSRGELTMLDGEKGVAKSLITIDITSRLTRGVAMPDGTGHTGSPLTVIIFTMEASAETETRPRLDAAGADVNLVFRPKVRSVRNAEGVVVAPEWSLPEGASQFDRAIRGSHADLAIFDPINDFFSEKINTHNDASVRHALMPLGEVLGENNCAGCLIRHMNKNTTADAKFRGAGSTAYQNRARIHLVAAAIPEDQRPDSGARYGLVIVDSNKRRVSPEVLSYDVVDSEMEQSDDGDLVPKIKWYESIKMNANELTAGRSPGRGPDPYAQRELDEFLRDLFGENDTWEAKAVEQQLKDAGIKYNDTQKAKAKYNLGIRSYRGRGNESGKWFWTTAKIRVRG
jgi:hypothetical protein